MSDHTAAGSPTDADRAKTHFYFMGICGTAMGAVASALKVKGFRVSGSDAKVYPPMSTFLREQGIVLTEGYNAANIPADADYIVVGNALGRGNPEVEEVLTRRLRYRSLPETLKEFHLQGRHNYVVCGTHGKTTTTSMLAWMLECAGLAPDFMIGGLPENFGRGGRLQGSDYVVLEGDEYDTAFFDKRSKFVHYLPEVALVNNIEFDHADIFDNLEAIIKSFSHMVRLVPSNGLIIVNGDDKNIEKVIASEAHAPVKKVGFGEHCDVRITGVAYNGEVTSFVLDGEAFSVKMPGEFNIRNAAMAATAALHAGITAEQIRRALESFAGVRRRQQVRGTTGRGVTVVDDFGHHPTAIRQAIEALRHRFPGRRLWAAFEPRSNTTRRKVFQHELPAALALADGVCVSAVENAAKVPEDDRLDPAAVMEELRSLGRPAFYESGADAIVERLKQEVGDGDVVVVFSNGGFDNIHDKLLAAL
ncbi:MAG: UDP-N-acetylmuramate:L-alanyl-gamma-D-glutamyl-meso-diaminopimelate ligase [Verrucomicrobiales bacterium]